MVYPRERTAPILTRPTLIRCACCGETIPPRMARQAVLSWPRSASGDGTMSDPQELVQTNVWIGDECWRRREGKASQRLFAPLIDRMTAALRQLVGMWVRPASEAPRELFPSERRVG